MRVRLEDVTEVEISPPRDGETVEQWRERLAKLRMAASYVESQILILEKAIAKRGAQ